MIDLIFKVYVDSVLSELLLPLPPHFRWVHSWAAITLVNKCNYTVWPGVVTLDGSPELPTTGFVLPKNESRTINAPTFWVGKIWGRTHCSVNTTRNFSRFSCLTGDCGSGKIECAGLFGVKPVTQAMFYLNQFNDTNLYELSIDDGYNLPMLIVPQGGTGVNCSNTGCISDLNHACPSKLKVTSTGGEGVACKSACDAFGTKQYCCNGTDTTPKTCKATSYSEYFKKACPHAYKYFFDNETSTFSCAGADYLITFCPSATDESVYPTPPALWKRKTRWLLKFGAVLGGGIAALSILSYVVFWRWRKAGLIDTKLDLSGPTKLSASFLPSDIRCFSLAEIKSSTNNFDDNLVIGVGGFGNVYKGYIGNGATTVAIKRLNALSNQGIHEFKTEIKMLSKLRHLHLVSLIGCCEDNGEMVLVYDYMANAIIHDIPEEPVNLAEWARCCYKTGALDEIIDLHLRDEIAPECLKKFADVAYICIQELGINRPSMNDVVWNLELALQLQEAAENISANGDALETLEIFTNLPFHLGEDASTEHDESLSRSIQLADSSRSSVLLLSNN
ncbi:hypothetical protein LguiA_017310 [Lonicera macranthoides]